MVIAKTTSKRNITTANIWFCDKDIGFKDADIVNYAAVSEVWKGFKKNPVTGTQNSLINDLGKNEDEILGGINPKTRNAIRRADKESVKYKMFVNEQVTEDVISDFCKTYLAMYTSKGINAGSPDKVLESYRNAGALAVTVAYYNNQPIVYHSYVFDSEHTRLLHSCSDFRNESELKTIIGFANKGLHWFDICEFKNRNNHIYDWGGVCSFTEPNGIDSFKMSFGGTPVTYFNVTKAVTFKGRVYYFVFKIYKGLKGICKRKHS